MAATAVAVVEDVDDVDAVDIGEEVVVDKGVSSAPPSPSIDITPNVAPTTTTSPMPLKTIHLFDLLVVFSSPWNRLLLASREDPLLLF